MTSFGRIIIPQQILLRPVGERRYRVLNRVDAWIEIKTAGWKHIWTDPDFLFDGRSGGVLGDFFEPNLGTQPDCKCWWLHDANGYDNEGGFDFKDTNALLKEMRIRCKDENAALVHFAVSTRIPFTLPWFGVPLKTDWEYCNIPLIHVGHVHQPPRDVLILPDFHQVL